MKKPYVGFFRRALAFLVDSVLISLPPLVICVPLFISQYDALAELPEGDLQTAAVTGLAVVCYTLWQVIALITYWLYFAFCESGKKQATLGKRLLRIKVIGQDGKRISFARATGRAFARMLAYPTVYIGFVMAGCTRRNRALHDMVAQTYVVERDFTSTDELPDTPGHPVWLTVWITVLVGISLVGLITNLPQTDEETLTDTPVAPTEVSAPTDNTPVQQAAEKLLELARTQSAAPTGLQADGNRYYRHADGYRALLPGSVTLFVPNGADAVCCEDDGNNTCAATGLTPCP